MIIAGIDHIVYCRPIWDGILIDAVADMRGIEWAVITCVIWCGVPRYWTEF